MVLVGCIIDHPQDIISNAFVEFLILSIIFNVLDHFRVNCKEKDFYKHLML